MVEVREKLSFLIDFIKLVQKNPCLWNCHIKSYNKTDVTGLAWQNIAAEVKDTEQNCRDRWKNIRCAYVRSLKPSKSKSGIKSKRPYYLAEYLLFLTPYMKVTDPFSNVHVPSEENDNDDHDDLGALLNDTQTHATNNFCIKEESLSESSTASQPSNFEECEIIQQPISHKKRKMTPKKEVENAFVEWIDVKECQQGKRHDVDLMFFESMLPDLKKLDDRRKRVFKAKVMYLLNDMLDNAQELSNAPFSSSSLTSSNSLATPQREDNFQTLSANTSLDHTKWSTM